MSEQHPTFAPPEGHLAEDDADYSGEELGPEAPWLADTVIPPEAAVDTPPEPTVED